jgi:hypothetical protein
MNSWEPWLALMGVVIGLLSLLRDFFSWQADWAQSTNLLKRTLVNRPMLRIIAAVLIAVPIFSLSIRLQRLEDDSSSVNTKLPSASATQTAHISDSTIVPSVNLHAPAESTTALTVSEVADLVLSLEQANISLSGPTASPEKREEVRKYLFSRWSGYPALAENCLKILNGRKLKKPLHLDTLNGKYVGQIDPSVDSLRPDQYNDLEKLEKAILIHWNENYPKDATESLNDILE